ncbi:type II toxin-antitoxin system HigB family toxin [soil metagenome]
MRILTKKTLQSFWERYPDSKNALRYWYQTTIKAEWNNLIEVRNDFPHADLVGVCTIFNIGGNKYRLITKIYYPNKKVLIRFVLTHKEYDKKPYKNDCEC